MRFFNNLVSAPSFLYALAAAQAPSKSGNPGVVGTGTYPRATKLADGSLLGIYTNFAGGNNTLITAKSTNGGASWTAIGQVDTGVSTAKDIDNGFLHQLSSGDHKGRILAAFRNHDRKAGGGYSFYRITICSSDDNGKTWNFLQTPASDPGGVTGNWEPFIQDALDGSLQLYYSRETATDDQDSLLRRSTNGGADWSSAQVISGTGVTARDGMLGVTRISANSQSKLAIFESGVNGRFTLHTVRSDNDGTDWSSTRSLVYGSAGHNAGAPQIIRVGTKLVASFGTDEDGGVWPEGSIKLLVSTDQGTSWNYKTTVHGVPGYWAGLTELDDSSFLVLYESGGISYAQKMVF
ncbi:glycoside hydrolase family 93 protein [Lophiotrema nucula]|uniref:Glycoside hydrolase family 93 protein n=1 Tax=Lophiotrema nucula TaxID=690887 RepID=A0A6A5YUR1_9PLEO|nr:glycoside hydrolase family 93 protein [Lophiotrema nucula]